jgi:CheY-like chemotaxis protein
VAPILRQSGIREPTASRRVLIVDDHVDSADLAAVLLTQSGHEVRVEYGPLPALSMAARFEPQIVLLDIELPTIDGYQLATLLRSLPALARCRFVALTACAFERDRRKSEAAGFYCHLTKPFGVQALFDAVNGDDAHSSCAPPAGWSAA